MDEGLRSWDKLNAMDRSFVGGLLSRKTSKKPDTSVIDEKCGVGNPISLEDQHAFKRDELFQSKKPKTKKHQQTEAVNPQQTICFDVSRMKIMAKRPSQWELSRKKSSAYSSSLPRSPKQVA